MRKLAMSGLAGIAVALGCATLAAATPAYAAAAPGSTAHITPAQARAASASGFSLGGRISCGSPSTCLAVQAKSTSSGKQVAIAEVRNGTKWKSVSVPKPKGAGAPVLTGVSCKSANSCLVIGEYPVSSQNSSIRPYAMTWNGTALKLTAAMPLPSGYSLIGLNALSCVSTAHCLAIGSAVRGKSLPVMLVETWNGAKWSERTARNPGGTALALSSAASCRSLTSCVIAGEAISVSGADKILFSTWNGKSFTTMKTAQPAGAKSPLIADLSCTSAKSCAAVGFSLTSTGASRGFAEVWKGTKWTPATIAWPKADTESFLMGVSCVSATNCVTVGAAGTSKSGSAKALYYNGMTWKFQQVPGPGAGRSSTFESVSCPKAKDCTAIGEIGATSGSSTNPLGGLWTGAAWKLMAA